MQDIPEILPPLLASDVVDNAPGHDEDHLETRKQLRLLAQAFRVLGLVMPSEGNLTQGEYLQLLVEGLFNPELLPVFADEDVPEIVAKLRTALRAEFDGVYAPLGNGGTNTPPVASNVKLVLPAIPKVGDVATITFTQTDAEGDAPGPPIKRYFRADDDQGTNRQLLVVATSYVVATADIGKKLTADVGAYLIEWHRYWRAGNECLLRNRNCRAGWGHH